MRRTGWCAAVGLAVTALTGCGGSSYTYPSTVICLLQGADGQPLTGSARR